MDWEVIDEFENKIAEFFGAPYAVATDSATHGIELCLRYTKAKEINCPKRTYLSIPFLADKLGIDRNWIDSNWEDYYYLTDRVVDAAVLWKPDGYVTGTLMNISFQYQKHLSLGRGGMILCDDLTAAMKLKKMSYDGRLPGIHWREQNIDSLGFHYYMTIETAALGIKKLPDAINTEPRKWTVTDWPDLTQMKVFKQ